MVVVADTNLLKLLEAIPLVTTQEKALITSVLYLKMTNHN